ncbi:MAG: 1-acyl-sn-glycerol-3-phosphate acyltransferase [Pseudomonadota bacterium]
MQLLRSLLYDALIYTLMAVMGILCAPLAALSRDWTYAIVRTYCGMVLWLLRVLCGIRVEVRGPIPQGEVLVASKHQSFLDILIHSRHLPRPRFIMKREMLWMPVIGIYGLRMGSTPVHRGRRGAAVRQMVRGAEQQVRPDPGQLIIYPQGTRLAPGIRAPYKVGAGILYDRLGVDCVPAATNAGVLWGRKSLRRIPGLAVVEYLPTIPAGLPQAEFMARLENSVETASDALMAEAGFPLAPAPAAAGT